MVSNSRGSWTVRGVTFLLWAAAAASVAYWGLKLSSRNAAGPALVQPNRAPAAADPAALARLLGHTPNATAIPTASLSSRFSLMGVVAGRSRGGAALIAVDGKPAKPFQVGSRVDEGLVLQAVDARRAVLAASTAGQPVLTLEMAPLPR